MKNFVKDKNFIMCLLCGIGIILSLFLFEADTSIADLSILNAQLGDDGKYEAPSGVTIIEKMGLMYLSSGVAYQFGTTREAVEIGFQTILNMDLSELDSSNNGNGVDSIISIEDYVNQDSTIIEEDDVIGDITEIDWTTVYDKKEYKTLDENGKEINEKDTILSITTPTGFKPEDMENISNMWNINYRLYDGFLTGVAPSYWGSELFKTEEYFERAFTSLKWICQDYLNSIVMEDNDNFYGAIIYSVDEEYYWYLTLEKLENAKPFDDKNAGNFISMEVLPISINEVKEILEAKGILETFE